MYDKNKVDSSEPASCFKKNLFDIGDGKVCFLWQINKFGTNLHSGFGKVILVNENNLTLAAVAQANGSSDVAWYNMLQKGKHVFGVVTVGEKGQIVIPAKARKVFDIKAGDQLIVLGDEEQGIAIVKGEDLLPRLTRNGWKEGFWHIISRL